MSSKSKRKTKRNRNAGMEQGLGSSDVGNGETFIGMARGNVTVPFRRVISIAATSTAALLDLVVGCTSLGSRITAVSVNFIEWRLKRLRITVMPNPALSDIAVGYNNTAYNAANPASFTQVLETMPCNVVNGAVETRPSTLNVPPRYLRAIPYKWLRVVQDTATNYNQVNHGQITAYARAAITGTINIVVDGIIQFRSPALTGIHDDEKVAVDPLSECVLSYTRLQETTDVPSPRSQFSTFESQIADLTKAIANMKSGSSGKGNVLPQ